MKDNHHPDTPLASAAHEPAEAAADVVFNNSPVALMVMRPWAAITRVNDRFVAMTGYARAELLGKTLAELGLMADDVETERVLNSIRHDGSAEQMPLNLRRKDGSICHTLISTCTLAVDQVPHRLHSFVDISEQRRVTQESRLVHQAINAVSQGVLISDANLLTLSVNRALEAMTGYTQAELVGQPISIFQGPDSNRKTVRALQSALRTGQAFVDEVLTYRKDGTTFWNELSINPLRDSDGRLTHFVGVLRDVSERREQQARLRLSAQVFAQSGEGVVITDAANRVVMVNQAFTGICGYRQDELIGKNPSALSSGRQDRAYYQAMWHAIEASGRWQGEIWNRNRHGVEYLQWLSIGVLRDDSGAVCNYIGSVRDITDERAAHARIDWLSHFDPLTGLPNRALLADRVSHDIVLAQRDGKQTALIKLGVDGFRNINETFGHAVADRLLKKLAARLQQAVREQDTVARVGDDEFVVALPNETPEGAAILATRLLQTLSQPFGVANVEVTLSASIGIAVCPTDGHDFETLAKCARAAMYDAKQHERGSYRFFNANVYQSNQARATLTSALRDAIGLEQLRLHYQPFVDLQTGRIGGMEALLRWTHPELGEISPGSFIPLAEQSGAIVAIGYWVLRQACHDLRQWRDAGIAVPPVSVNLSPAQFRDPDLLGKIEATLREFQIEPELICLELTEGAVMDDVAHSENLMRMLKSLGLHLALDDFGTGYSSLSYLKLFPFDKVKIDQSFVRDITKGAHDAVIAKVVISMAHGLGLRVIAEGVETEAQCEFMRANVCDEIQGYFFSRPVPMQAMQALLQEDRRLPAHLMREQRRARTLLLVDDEPNVISALKRLLRRDGYQILTASSGPEGLELLQANPVDIIVADQRMPGMTGVEFLRRAKTLHPDTMRIVLSGHTELQSVTDAINEGAIYRFLTKPWDDEQLRGFIQEAFHHKELADENTLLNLKIRTANQELASSNRQLQEAVETKQHQISRGQQSLNVVQEALQNVPMPLLALDDEDMIAFANEHAQRLFAGSGPLLASEIDDVLPELGALLNRLSAGESAQTKVGEKWFRVVWYAMGESSTSSGRIVTLSPEPSEALN